MDLWAMRRDLDINEITSILAEMSLINAIDTFINDYSEPTIFVHSTEYYEVKDIKCIVAEGYWYACDTKEDATYVCLKVPGDTTVIEYDDLKREVEEHRKKLDELPDEYGLSTNT